MTKPNDIVVSGMRPTGLLHLGHFFGVLRNWTALQKQYTCYFFVADWHSLTTEYANIGDVSRFTQEMVIDWLAAGVSPDKAVMFVQSQVPAHAELHVLLSMITPLGWLERVPSYKELQNELTGKDLSTYGFLGYPLLQTADVAIYKATRVPVGQDQVAHIELSREVLRRFNHLYKETFPEPQALLTQTPKVPGTDGRKMSKSYNNSIYLSDSEEQMNVKIKGAMTDPARKLRQDPGNPDICPIFAYHQQVTTTELAQINADCRTAAIGCVDCKKILMKNLSSCLGEFRTQREVIAAKPQYVKDVIAQGVTKARAVSEKNLIEVNEAMGLRS